MSSPFSLPNRSLGTLVSRALLISHARLASCERSCQCYKGPLPVGGWARAGGGCRPLRPAGPSGRAPVGRRAGLVPVGPWTVRLSGLGVGFGGPRGGCLSGRGSFRHCAIRNSPWWRQAPHYGRVPLHPIRDGPHTRGNFSQRRAHEKKRSFCNEHRPEKPILRLVRGQLTFANISKINV